MGTENKYRYTRAYFKILDLIMQNPEERVFVIRGGQGASKTVSILQLLIQSLLSSEKEATVLSSELVKMKRTVVRDYKKICKDWGIFRDETDFNKSESKHEYPNDSYLDFLGADVNDIGKGYRRDLLYINEADKLSLDTAVQFISRAKLTIIDYNPDSRFWGDDYINANNFLTLTYEDNEYLPIEEVESILDYKKKGFFNPDLEYELLFADSNIKNKYWANRWKVYGLGMTGALEGVVFSNWRTIDALPPEAKLKGYGMDFGYTNDPTTVIGCYEYNGHRIYDEVIYQTGLGNSDRARLMAQAGITKQNIIYADRSAPENIAELRARGFYVMPYPTKKEKEGINYGISLMQEGEFFVTKRSINMINELQNYIWLTGKEGNTTNEPIDAFNHALDGARYFEMGNKLQQKITVI